jgi:RNA polymerase sigma factor (sigma-70 family)
VIVREVVGAGKVCGRLTERWLNGKAERVPFLSQFGPVGLEGDEQEFIPDGRGGDRPYGEDELKVLRAALSRIPEMERVVLVRRFFDRETLLEIGTALGVSKEAIRQTQQKALARLRQMMMDDES